MTSVTNGARGLNEWILAVHSSIRFCPLLQFPIILKRLGVGSAVAINGESIGRKATLGAEGDVRITSTFRARGAGLTEPSLATANPVEAIPDMFAFRRWWRAVATVVALSSVTSAAPALTTIQDVLYKADGSRFNGTITITWNNFQTGDDNPIPAQGLSLAVVNGFLKVRLAPTTNASAGANYTVKYASQGQYIFSETWAVPYSTYTLRIRDVRVGTGTVVGAPPPITTQVLIADVSGLSNELSARPMRGSGYSPGRAVVINSGGQLDAAAGNLSDCLRVDGSSGPCGTGGDSSVAYADAETPSGLVNSINTSYTLNFTPDPAASLAFFRNGVLMKQGADYTLNGNVVTFYTASAPQTGDLLTASYRYSSAVSLQSGMMFADGETPVGPVNGINSSFTLNSAPSPPASLALYRNGILMKQGADYTVSGNVITFYPASMPMPGDLLTAFYRYELRT